MKVRLLSRFGAAMGSLFLAINSVIAQGTAFTYQGQLQNNGSLANGSYNLTFTLFNTNTGGTAVAGPITNSAIAVTNGLFTVTIDFGGSVWNGATNWLQIGVETNGASNFSTLTPRQQLTPTPYAIYAEGASAAGISGTLPGGSIGGTYANQVTFNNGNDTFDGTFHGEFFGTSFVGGEFSGDGSALVGVWHTAGDFGTNPNQDFLGTRDNEPLQIRVNDTVAVQYSPAPTAPNIVAGLSGYIPTFIGSNVSGAVVAGGGAPSGAVTGTGGGDYHAVYDNDGTIGGGFGNKVGSPDSDVTDGAFATVGGGVFNSAANYAAVVAGGDANTAAGGHSAVLGGYVNQAMDVFTVLLAAN